MNDEGKPIMDEQTKTLHRTSITIGLGVSDAARAVAMTRELLDDTPEDSRAEIRERIRGLETVLGRWIEARGAILRALSWEESAAEAERKGYGGAARANRNQVALSLNEALDCVRRANETADRENARTTSKA